MFNTKYRFYLLVFVALVTTVVVLYAVRHQRPADQGTNRIDFTDMLFDELQSHEVLKHGVTDNWDTYTSDTSTLLDLLGPIKSVFARTEYEILRFIDNDVEVCLQKFENQVVWIRLRKGGKGTPDEEKGSGLKNE